MCVLNYDSILVHKSLVDYPYTALINCLAENLVEFNISWVRGGHPVLNVGDLSIEASQSMGLLLDQLRLPTGNSLSNSTIIVLINRYSPFSGCIYNFHFYKARQSVYIILHIGRPYCFRI